MQMPKRDEWDVVWEKVQDRIHRIHRDTLTLKTDDVGHGSDAEGAVNDLEAENDIVSGKSEDKNITWKVWLDQQRHLVMELNTKSDSYHGRQVTVTLPVAIANLGNEGIDIEWVNDLPEGLPSSALLSKEKRVSITLGTLDKPLDGNARTRLKELLCEPELTFEEGSQQPSAISPRTEDAVGKDASYIALGVDVDQNVSWKVWLDPMKFLVMELKVLSDNYGRRKVTVTLPAAVANLGELNIEWVNDSPMALPSSVSLSTEKWVPITLGLLKTPLDRDARAKLKALLGSVKLTFEEGSETSPLTTLPKEGVSAIIEETSREMTIGTHSERHQCSEGQGGSCPEAIHCFLSLLLLAMWTRMNCFKFVRIVAYFQYRFASESEEKGMRPPLAGMRLMTPVFAGYFTTATIWNPDVEKFPDPSVISDSRVGYLNFSRRHATFQNWQCIRG
jgi:hypothetical protein